MHKYSINVVWSEEDGGYVALVPEFPGLSGFGETVEQAIVEVHTALNGAIETYQAEGWSLPEPRHQTEYSGKFMVRLPKSLHGRLVQQANEEGVSLNLLVATVLSEAVGLTQGASRMERTLAHVLQLWNTSVRTMAALVWSHQAGTVTRLVNLTDDRRRYPKEIPAASAHVGYAVLQQPGASPASATSRELIRLE
jgi:antitoxin HicB